jgi:hypothetical protein
MSGSTDWSYRDGFYAGKMAAAPFEIRTDPVRGKALFATRAFSQGDIIFTERAYCLIQDVEDAVAAIPVCSGCLKPLESARDIVRRAAGDALAAEMPDCCDADAGSMERVKCRNDGCPAIYCCSECEALAWDERHCELCVIEHPDSAADVRAFATRSWPCSFVHWSDPHVWSLHAVATALAAHRQRNLPLLEALEPLQQLARSPVQHFWLRNLMYDVLEDRVPGVVPEREDADGMRRRRWLAFLKYIDCPEQDPVAQFDRDTQPSWDEMLVTGYGLMRKALRLSAAESAVITIDEWSLILGSFMRNSHTLKPHLTNAYETYKTAVSQVAAKAVPAFHKKLREADVDPRSLEPCARGAGMFVVGACMNHNCTPNVLHDKTRCDDGRLCLTALKDVAEGAELNISYVDVSDHVYARQQQLYEHFCFRCDCVRCKTELAQADASGTD